MEEGRKGLSFLLSPPKCFSSSQKKWRTVAHGGLSSFNPKKPIIMPCCVSGAVLPNLDMLVTLGAKDAMEEGGSGGGSGNF